MSECQFSGERIWPGPSEIALYRHLAGEYAVGSRVNRAAEIEVCTDCRYNPSSFCYLLKGIL